MIRLFNVYFSTRSVLRLLFEITIICGTLLLVSRILLGQDAYIALVYENGLIKLGSIAGFTVILSYYFDLYAPRRIPERWEIYFRLLLVLSALAFTLAAVVVVFPEFEIGQNVLIASVMALAVLLVLWRQIDEWFIHSPYFRERVCVIGGGPKAKAVVELLRSRPDAGYEIVKWSGEDSANQSAECFDADLKTLSRTSPLIDRVIIALENRRGVTPIRALLHLRLAGVLIEDSHAIIERLSGIVPIEGLSPAALIYSSGFGVRMPQRAVRRMLSVVVASTALLICLPFLPLIALAVRLSSPGPIFFRQTRVGYHGRLFTTLKFRTMRQDAEKNGAVWAKEGDSRITSIGRLMRKTRLDEIPQLWNVLRGDMGFVGPRPERPEFVEWLSKEIPFYELRHMIRPGLTGWAQVRYKYGASLEETKRKLEYDLYYLKHLSVGLDLLIIFETIKTVILRRGAQ